MVEKKIKSRRPKVRAENPSGACGKIEHMTIDELREIAVGDNFDGSCPACGLFHMTREDIEVIESEKISDSEYYAEIKREAEAES